MKHGTHTPHAELLSLVPSSFPSLPWEHPCFQHFLFFFLFNFCFSFYSIANNDAQLCYDYSSAVVVFVVVSTKDRSRLMIGPCLVRRTASLVCFAKMSKMTSSCRTFCDDDLTLPGTRQCAIISLLVVVVAAAAAAAAAALFSYHWCSINDHVFQG